MGHYCVAFCKPRPQGFRENLHNVTIARNTVLISYKEPFVLMLEDAEKDLQMGHYTHSEIDTMFKDIVAQTVGDGENTDGDCDNDDIKEFGRETSTAWNAVNSAASDFRQTAIQQIRDLKRKYESLDESQICGDVDAGDPLAVFALNMGMPIMIKTYLNWIQKIYISGSSTTIKSRNYPRDYDNNYSQVLSP